MNTPIAQKLVKIADDIASKGDATLTRLTVLKKWLDQPGRMPAFALWMAYRAIAREGKSKGKAAELFRDALALLDTLDKPNALNSDEKNALWSLHARLRSFQNVHRKVHWGTVRTIDNWNLFLVESALEIILRPNSAPADGYKLAANYCQHYDPKYANGLNGPSRKRILEIAEWLDRQPPTTIPS
jgi:hypothetical protein